MFAAYGEYLILIGNDLCAVIEIKYALWCNESTVLIGYAFKSIMNLDSDSEDE